MISLLNFYQLWHYAAIFPVWLAPVQVKLLPVSDKYLSYADTVLEKLRAADIRVEIDTRDEKLGYKIREAQLDKVPFMVIVGEKEQANDTVSVRRHDDSGRIPTFAIFKAGRR